MTILPPKIPLELQSVIDAQDHAFVLIDEDYNIVAANKAYTIAYGTNTDSVINQKCFQVSHHSDTPCWKNGEDCPHQQVFATGEAFHVLHIHYDQYDREEHVRIKGSPIHGANNTMYLGEAIYPVTNRDELSCNQQRLIGSSAAFLECIESLSSAARIDAPVLLCGESGVGKDLAAHFIHEQSSRKGRPFVRVDCSAISERVFESELFGHERGAFTGCVGRRHGLLESADGGTLFLDEVGDMPMALQGRLLHALETGQFRRVGGRHVLDVDVRIISATQYDLQAKIDDWFFRPDLYYRLAGNVLRIPSLRERHEDIPSLVSAIMSGIEDRNHVKCRVSGRALDKLLNYSYPGNIRELKNILQQAATTAIDGFITVEHLQFDNNHYVSLHAGCHPVISPKNMRRSKDELEKEHIEALLQQYGGHRAQVAKVLKISERTLYRKIKSYKLQKTGK